VRRSMIATAEVSDWPPNLRRQDAARYLREVHGIPVQPTTLSKWFCISSDGPPAFKAGRTPLYPRDQLDAWAVRRLGPLRTSTSEAKAA
jgi:hypothetical protein